MSESNVDVKVRTKYDGKGIEDAESALSRLKAEAKATQMEERAEGGTALERGLKTGAIFGLTGFAIEEVGKFAKASDEAFRGYLEGTDKAYEGTQKLLEAVPVFGHIYEAAENLVTGIEDGAAAFAKMEGASDDTVRSLESYDEQIAESNARIKENVQTQKDLADLKKILAGTDEVAETQQQKRLAAIAKHYDDQIKQLGELDQKFGGKEHQRTEEARGRLEIEKATALAKQKTADIDKQIDEGNAKSDRERAAANAAVRRFESSAESAKIDALRAGGKDTDADKQAAADERDDKVRQLQDQTKDILDAYSKAGDNSPITAQAAQDSLAIAVANVTAGYDAKIKSIDAAQLQKSLKAVDTVWDAFKKIGGKLFGDADKDLAADDKSQKKDQRQADKDAVASLVSGYSLTGSAAAGRSNISPVQKQTAAIEAGNKLLAGLGTLLSEIKTVLGQTQTVS